MKKKLLLLTSYILVAALATVITMYSCAEQQEISKLEELENLIEEKFIGDSDRTAMEDAAAEAMVASLGDRWSYYIPADQYAAHMEQMNNAYVGIGITIQADQEEEGFLILAVTEGGPAEEAGLLPGDILIAVEGTPMKGIDTDETRNLVRGEEGSFVELTIRRDGQEQSYRVERRTIETVVARWEMLPEKIGYIAIENFDRRCAKETIAAIDTLIDQGAAALIFDVRGNPGGYADEMVQVLDYLLPEGELFRTLDYAGEESVDYSDADFLDIPMVVLVNGDSYSAAEFFGAALREYEAATLVGQPTSGKGYFQYTLELSDGSAVGLSVGKYFTPKGENLAGIGITPDVLVEVDEETQAKIYYDQLPIQEDVQLQAAVAVLTGK